MISPINTRPPIQPRLNSVQCCGTLSIDTVKRIFTYSLTALLIITCLGAYLNGRFPNSLTLNIATPIIGVTLLGITTFSYRILAKSHDIAPPELYTSRRANTA